MMNISSITYSEKTYRLVIIGILILSITWSTFHIKSDFAQDYLAACAIRDGIDSNLPTLYLAKRYNVPEQYISSNQTAHPPLVTLLSIPFAAFPWDIAHFLWEFLLCASVGILLVIQRIRLQDLIFLSPAWIFGLAIGNIDAVVVCLCLIAMSSYPRINIGVLLGIAAALKVYPLFLIIGITMIRNYRQSVLALLTGGVLTFAAALYIGFENFTGWLAYIVSNGNFFAASTFNISLSKFAVAIGYNNLIFLCLGVIMLCLQTRQKNIEPLLAGMLLISPTSWIQQITILSNRLRFDELISCSVCCVSIILVQYYPVPFGGYITTIATTLLTCTVIITYVRLFRSNR